jgi:hypothetical protein
MSPSTSCLKPHFLTLQMVNSRGQNQGRNQGQNSGQQLPPQPLIPSMEQFIIAQLQLLQNLTALMQQCHTRI